jgi:uncharacterized protein (TIGR00730 family)
MTEAPSVAAPQGPSSQDPGAQALRSVCVYCASSNAADPAYLAAAEQFGRILAQSGVRLVYGGGGIGLMGATARGAHEAGGKVLGIMPAFLTGREILFDDVETLVVQSMHERKQIMFEQSDAFAILPGGIGTLEEIVELMSWRRLELHRKPMVFYNPDGFWEPLFRLIDHTIDQNLTPAWFRGTWRAAATIEDVLPAMREMMPAGPQMNPADLV